MNKPYYPPVVNCLIVDADPDRANELGTLLRKIASISIIAHVADASGALQMISKIPRVDILFFGTGKCNPHAFEIADILRNGIKCKVFIGDDNDCALRAFHAGADSFLQRPLEASVFESKIKEIIACKIRPERLIASNEQLWIPVLIHNSKHQSA